MRISAVCIMLLVAAAWTAALVPAAEDPGEATHLAAESADNAAGGAEDVPAQPNDEASDEPDSTAEESLNLRADQIIYEGDTFTCTENVVITYGVSRVECDKVVGTIAEVEKPAKEGEKPTKEKAIVHLVAIGSPIKMVSEERQAKCLKAVYDLLEGKVVLTGSEEHPPELTQEGGTARSERITYLINEKKFIFDKSSEIKIPVGDTALPSILE